LRSARHPADVLGKLARAYADDVDEGGTVSTILDQVAAIVDRFASTGTYDAIMIDARAGLHETTAAAILGLGAEVFLFGLDEYQTFLGYSILFSHLALFLESDKEQRPEWLERITMVQGRASEKPELREQFAASCQRLFESSGLTLRPNKSPTDVPLPAEPFGDVPWNDEVGDEELQLDEPVGPRATLAILDDERFRVFNPRMRRDLLSSAVYRSSYGELIDRIAELVAVSNRI